MSGTRVLVTGSAGYVGSELVKQLGRRGIEHLSVDRDNRAGTASIDLCDRPQTAKAIGNFRPDMLVHCGTNSALAYRDRFLDSFRDDGLALANILESLSKLPGCRLICFSSTYVYSGISRNDRVSESTPLQPTHNFGVAKAFFEQLALRCHPDTVVFRLSSVYGPGHALYPNAILKMAQECLTNGKVTVWGAGSRMMQYVYMPDVLACISGASSLPPGIYNLGGDKYLSVMESARLIANYFGAEVEFLGERKEGETLPFMDTAKLKRYAASRFTPFEDSLDVYLGALAGRFKPTISNRFRP